MSNSYLIILAGGLASRMKKAEDVEIGSSKFEEANKKTKSMITIGRENKPFLDYLVLNAKYSGYSNVHVVIGEKDNSIKEHYSNLGNDDILRSINFSFSVQRIPEGRIKPLGTADALHCALKDLTNLKGKNFSVCNSDNLYSVEALKIVNSSNYLNSMINYDREGFSYDSDRTSSFAINLVDENNYLIDIIEKPEEQYVVEIKKRFGFVGVSMNLFNFSYDMIVGYLENLPLSSRGEKELPNAVKLMIQDNPKSLYAYKRKEHVPDLTSKKDILIVEKYINNSNEGIK